jgi:hypothetical protein
MCWSSSRYRWADVLVDMVAGLTLEAASAVGLNRYDPNLCIFESRYNLYCPGWSTLYQPRVMRKWKRLVDARANICIRNF